MKCPKILIVGRSGQLAQALASLCQKDNAVLSFRGRNDHNFFDLDSTIALIQTLGVEVVINTAAYTAVDKAEAEPDAAYRINADLPRTLAEACMRTGAALIHVSTDYVFDGAKPVGEFYTPEDAPNPINVYGNSKLAGERAVHDVLPAATIVRTSWLMSDFGQNFQTTMKRLLVERDSLNVVNDQWGTPTQAVNLGRYLLDLAFNSNQSSMRIRHYSDGQIMTWFQLVQSMEKQYMPARESIVVPISTSEYGSQAARGMNTALAPSPL